jgi:hypothetical protein
MTVEELMELLKTIPPQTKIVMSSDSEGNTYSPLSSHGLGVYVPDSTWSGDFYSIELTAEDNCMDEDGWTELKADPANSALCFWPVS